MANVEALTDGNNSLYVTWNMNHLPDSQMKVLLPVPQSFVYTLHGLFAQLDKIRQRDPEKCQLSCQYTITFQCYNRIYINTRESMILKISVNFVNIPQPFNISKGYIAYTWAT